MQRVRHPAASVPPGGLYPRILASGVSIALASFLILLAGCATHTAPPAGEASEVPAGSAMGTWQGTTTTNGNGIRKITLRMTQTGSDVTGDYSCAPGNTACRNLNDSGTISGKVTGNSFAVKIVMSPDNSQCFFTGRLAESLIFGNYQCLADGRFVELGSWRVKRVG
ncbi:MAG: hypothetical protein ABSD31_17935 [Candidatus Binataceae bacterium]|jgi:hypothetical protein